MPSDGLIGRAKMQLQISSLGLRLRGDFGCLYKGEKWEGSRGRELAARVLGKEPKREESRKRRAAEGEENREHREEEKRETEGGSGWRLEWEIKVKREPRGSQAKEWESEGQLGGFDGGKEKGEKESSGKRDWEDFGWAVGKNGQQGERVRRKRNLGLFSWGTKTLPELLTLMRSCHQSRDLHQGRA